MEKMTKKDYFAELKALAENAGRTDLIEFVNHELDLLAKKNTRRTDKPSKSAMETAELAERVLKLMASETRYTATDLVKAIGEVGISNQRMTAALNVLINTGFVKNERSKGKSYFYKA